jgi:hypothetical protein
MKKFLIAIAMVLSLSMNAEAAAQTHRHSPRTEQTDSTKNNQDAIEAFSDTTTVADEDSIVTRQHIDMTKEDARDIVHEVFSSLDSGMVFSMLTALGVLFILFVLFPIIVIITVVYFINRNRRERIKLAQMAMQNGQPIPDEILKGHKDALTESDDYQKGIRQMFTGVGLAIFLGIVAGEVGFGIGALVFFIGLGKWYIARKSGIPGNDSMFNNPSDNMNHSNNSNIKDYD